MTASALSPEPSSPNARLRSLPRRAYRFRVLGMGLAALPVMAVLGEIEASWPAWAWMAIVCFAWPHAAYLLAILSADPFKAELRNFIDSYGHGIGDDVLLAVAGIMRHTLPVGSHAGRLGGDEFAAALPMGLREAEAIAERLRATVEAMEFPHHPGLRCSVSLGVAAPPDAGLALREWMEAADRALYRAKNAGRNRAVARDPVQPPSA